ncbi:MAG: metal ABC transporter ATP-binding protein [Spirochaetaceae bacterium]|nr:metal ABC transporter ATP-binding protein [Spirochaetaceae bacterium]
MSHVPPPRPSGLRTASARAPLAAADRTDRPACGRCGTSVEGLSVRRGGRLVLNEVSLNFHCGEATVIIGRNGAGKSTLLKALLGLVPHSGRVRHSAAGRSGRGPLGRNAAGRPVFGYVPQGAHLDHESPTTVADLFASALSRRPLWLGRAAALDRRIEEALAVTGAGGLSGSRLGALSGGELQRVLLAFALEPMPDVLLLDEPVSGVDHAGMRDFYALLSRLRREHDLAIVMVSHDFDLAASIADRIVFLDGRVVCSGPPEEVFAHPAVVEAFGEIKAPSREGRAAR